MKIIHITAALGGGIAHSLSQLALAQVLDGNDVVVVHSIRAETPVEQLSDLYPEPINRREMAMATSINLMADLLAVWRLYRLMRTEKPDVIHLHSSKAGVLGRIAAFSLGQSEKVFYSPRGFSFLREDVSPIKRKLFLGIERFSSMLGGTLIGCSESETKLALSEVRHARSYLVENSVDLSGVPIATGSDNGNVKIATSGRICYQKAPWRFKELAHRCSDMNIDFEWLGEGDLLSELMVDGVLPKNIQISGWLAREGVYARLKKVDVFVLPSLWEGMPLALIEAQAIGLPAIVSDVIGNRDVVIDGITGFVCRDEEDFLAKCRLLVSDSTLRKKMGVAARKMAHERFSVPRMHNEMMKVYNVEA